MGSGQSTPVRKFGWIRDTRDLTAFRRKIEPHPQMAIVSVCDLRANCPPVYDQGELGSCTANAIGAAYAYSIKNAQDPSRLFLYYGERVIEGTVSEDSGAFLHDGYAVLQQTGSAPESAWPYDISKFAVVPPAEAYTEAATNKITNFTNIAHDAEQLKSVLLTGQPIAFGFVVYQSFMNIGADGMMPMPKATERQVGGHAVLMVGYDDTKQAFIVRNSWGASWGDQGYFYMPYSYALDDKYASDFWLIE